MTCGKQLYANPPRKSIYSSDPLLGNVVQESIKHNHFSGHFIMDISDTNYTIQKYLIGENRRLM